MIHREKFALLIIFLAVYTSQAQLQFLNVETNEPVSNVKIFSQGGEIIGTSNYMGFVGPEHLEVPDNDTLNIFHSDFTLEYSTLKELSNRKEFFLKPSPAINLEQVLITSNKPRYLKITGYFMSYQLIDDTPQSFADGIIEYYVDLKREKIKEYNIISSRLFKNKKWIRELRKTKAKAISLIGSNILPFSFEEEILLNEWKDSEVKFEEIISGDEVGTINRSEHTSDITIEYYTPENPRTISLFGLKTVVSHHLIREKFNSRNPRIEKLESISKYYASEMEKKGQRLDYELEQDFFVSNLEYLDKEQYKAAVKEFSHELNSGFSTEFREEYLNNIPPGIKNRLYKDLEIMAL